MRFAWTLARRYLRGKQRRSIGVITIVSVAGVALGVAALMVVQAVTSGFQRDFRDKVLGVNAHVLVMKYGVDFEEYREVVERTRSLPEVIGAGPFIIRPVMLASDGRLRGVLVKGVDPLGVTEVLELPRQLTDGSLDGLRLDTSTPPANPNETTRLDDESWQWLRDLRDARPGAEAAVRAPVEMRRPPVERGEAGTARRVPIWDRARRMPAPHDGDLPTPETEAETETPAPAPAPAPPVPADGDVLNPEDINALFEGGDDGFWDDEGFLDDSGIDEIVEEADAGDAEGGPVHQLPGMVVGSTLARELELEVGDRVQLMSPTAGLGLGAIAGTESGVENRHYRVIGIFEAGFQEYDSGLVFVDLHEAQRFYGHGDAVIGVELRLSDIEAADDVARRIERELGGPFHTTSWSELNAPLFTALAIQKAVLSIVIATITVVAAFTIIATLIMVVMEKKREIAILKALGCTDRDVLFTFLFHGMGIGLAGTIVGLLVGGGLLTYLEQVQFALDPAVYLIDHVPVVIDLRVILITAFTALGISASATLLPSWWAARLLPVDGLRYE